MERLPTPRPAFFCYFVKRPSACAWYSLSQRGTNCTASALRTTDTTVIYRHSLFSHHTHARARAHTHTHTHTLLVEEYLTMPKRCQQGCRNRWLAQVGSQLQTLSTLFTEECLQCPLDGIWQSASDPVHFITEECLQCPLDGIWQSASEPVHFIHGRMSAVPTGWYFASLEFSDEDKFRFVCWQSDLPSISEWTAELIRLVSM